LRSSPPCRRPTSRLIEKELTAAGADLLLGSTVVSGAIAARGGHVEEHDRLVREAVAHAADMADVLVLAQASMARAVDGVDLHVPVLTSPGGGMQSLLAALGTSTAQATNDEFPRVCRTARRMDRICAVSVSFSTSN